MNSKKTEKSIIGQINDMSHKLVLILVVPICLSLVLMLFYAGKYSRAISRMDTIASLKNIVALQIPETAWNIVSGRDSIEDSRIYHSIENVEKVFELIDRSQFRFPLSGIPLRHFLFNLVLQTQRQVCPERNSFSVNVAVQRRCEDFISD